MLPCRGARARARGGAAHCGGHRGPGAAPPRRAARGADAAGARRERRRGHGGGAGAGAAAGARAAPSTAGRQAPRSRPLMALTCAPTPPNYRPPPTHTSQIGKIVGARVVAVTSGATKAEFLRGLGADAVVDAAAAPPGTPLHKLIKAVAPKGAAPQAAGVGGGKGAAADGGLEPSARDGGMPGQRPRGEPGAAHGALASRPPRRIPPSRAAPRRRGRCV
jgi:hypothetical protein